MSKQIIHSTYVIDMPARKVKHGDIDNDFDTQRDNMKPSVEVQIDDCKLALKKYIRVSASQTAGYSIIEFAKKRVAENLAELKRLLALPKTPQPASKKLSIYGIKRQLQADKPLGIGYELDNYHMLKRLHKLGLITCDSNYQYVQNTEQGCRDIVRQTPTNKPDGVSKSQGQGIANALKREYKIIGECHVKRGGKPTATVYNVVGKFHGSKETFYILRCPVTGGTFGRTLENIYIPMAVS